MPPPYQKAYNYFRWDATEYMNLHRPAWTRANRDNTIATIWHGDNLTRAHYNTAPHHPTGPGMRDHNLILVVPYTARHAQRARTLKVMPMHPQRPRQYLRQYLRQYPRQYLRQHRQYLRQHRQCFHQLHQCLRQYHQCQ
ncbi:hypothetical protein HRS9122_03333 [Pyrenophora teres f. teres]|nr:hypothetical protein HRS9122_03333 [Pyrenophora teres f. teres]